MGLDLKYNPINQTLFLTHSVLCHSKSRNFFQSFNFGSKDTNEK